MSKLIMIEVVSGVEGPSVYINDHRVAGNKPWGGGRVLHSFKTTEDGILRALPELKSQAASTSPSPVPQPTGKE